MEKHGFMPKIDMADFELDIERRVWSKDLEGKLFKNFEELKKTCPKVEQLEKERMFEEFGIYSLVPNQKTGEELKFLEEKVAYKCSHCGTIVGGMPIIKKENTMGKHILAGRLGLDYYCKNCNRYIDSITFMCS